MTILSFRYKVVYSLWDPHVTGVVRPSNNSQGGLHSPAVPFPIIKPAVNHFAMDLVESRGKQTG